MTFLSVEMEMMSSMAGQEQIVYTAMQVMIRSLPLELMILSTQEKGITISLCQVTRRQEFIDQVQEMISTTYKMDTVQRTIGMIST